MVSDGSAQAEDWRLQAELDTDAGGRSLHGLIGRLRGPDVVHDLGAAVSPDVVITHDGRMLFAYASSETAIRQARAALEEVLRRDGVNALIRLSHWDEGRDTWRRVDPALSVEEQQAEAAADRAADEVQTRTLVASSGKLVRAEFEQSMLTAADGLGLQCEIIESHPHLLSSQVGFTVTGPKGKIDEFARALDAEGWAFVRTETAVMLSPL